MEILIIIYLNTMCISPGPDAGIHQPESDITKTTFFHLCYLQRLGKVWGTRLLVVILAAVAEILYCGFVHMPNILIILILQHMDHNIFFFERKFDAG